MYFAYVISTLDNSRFYKGSCSDLDVRLKEHNAGKTKSTKPFRPWKVVYFETFDTFALARQREKYFKSAAGRRFLKSKILAS